MGAPKLPADTTHRRCGKCDTRKVLDDFPRSPDKPLGRGHWCKACLRDYYKARRAAGFVPGSCNGRRGPLPKHDSHTPLPAMDLLERLECRRLARWATFVQPSPRFGVAMIGGGYV